MKVLTIPFSTNVERISLALGVKGLTAEEVPVDLTDRTVVLEVSGQELVPVLIDDDGTVVVDSPGILGYLELQHPDPPLWPAGAARSAEMNVFIEWFNVVWKVWPNAITAQMPGDHHPEHARHLSRSLDLFDSLLDGRDWLFGDAVSAADIIVFPFVKQAALGLDEDDPERFHHVLAEFQPLVDGRHEALRAWIHRVDALPRGL